MLNAVPRVPNPESRIPSPAMENANVKPKIAEIREKSQLMSASEIDRTLVRLANEILERNNGLAGVVLVGIRRRGVPLAERLAKKMMDIEKTAPPVETLDITFYRDDLSTVAQKPVVQESTFGLYRGGEDGDSGG